MTSVRKAVLQAMAKAAAEVTGKPTVVVADGDEATSCCGSWHEYSEAGQTVCKGCYRRVEPIYLRNPAAVPVWSISMEEMLAASDNGSPG